MSASDTATCPACNGSGFNSGDGNCGACSGDGSMPRSAAEAMLKRHPSLRDGNLGLAPVQSFGEGRVGA